MLQQNINQIASSDIKIILGDFNAKVEETIHKPNISNESLHNETNSNGIKMIQSAISNGLNLSSTTFPYKVIHRETGHSADSRMANQTDHVLISNRFRNAITEFRALRGPDIRSGHNLIKINFEVKLRAKTGYKYNEKRKKTIFFKIQSGNKNILHKLIISLKYWKIWTMKILLTICGL
jgi:hypothetical protein